MSARLRFAALPVILLLLLVAAAGRHSAAATLPPTSTRGAQLPRLPADFLAPDLGVWTSQQFTVNTGWRVDRHPRHVGDFDGDGRDDVLGFGDEYLWVGTSTGRAFAPSPWSEHYTYNEGWRIDELLRLVGDFNGDGRDEVIGFSRSNVIATVSDGSAFTTRDWTNDQFTYLDGWRVDRHPRLIGDFNGDGRDDVVGFGEEEVWVGLSTAGEALLSVWADEQLTYNTGWRIDSHPRLIGDFNGDGRDDVVGFGDQNVWVGLSSGTEFDLSVWTDQEFTTGTGWRVDRHPRLVGDFNGDGRDDVVGFGDANVWVGTSTGSAFTLSIWTDREFTYNTGWRVGPHPRLAGDFDGDGKDDVVGFGDANVWLGASTGAAFDLSVWTDREFTTNTGWGEDHPRLVGDFNGDGAADVVGFGDQNVWVGASSHHPVFLPLVVH